LAKSDLAYYYRQCIGRIEEVKRKAWEAYRSNDSSSSLKLKDKLLALKLTKECEAKFALFKDGPSVMRIDRSISSLSKRLEEEELQDSISQEKTDPT
jgi:hypothetical protein